MKMGYAVALSVATATLLMGSKCKSGGDRPPPRPQPSPEPAPPATTYFSNEEIQYPANECRKDRLKDVAEITRPMLDALDTMGWTGTRYGQTYPGKPAAPHHWLDANYQPGALDHVAADNARLAVFAGHGMFPYESFGGTIPIPHQTLPFAASSRNNAWESCYAMLSNAGDTSGYSSFSALGAEQGRLATHAIFFSSCTMQRQLAAEFANLNQVSQYFGFEYSPLLNDPDAPLQFLNWSASIGNARAWDRVMSGVLSNNGRTMGGAISVTQTNLSEEHMAQHHWARQSLGAKVWLDREVSNATNVLFDISEACVKDYTCGSPDWLSDCPDLVFADLGFEGFTGVPPSTQEHDPVGTPVFRLAYKQPDLTASDISNAAAILASHILEQDVRGSDLLPGIEANFASGRFDMHRPFGNLAFAFDPDRYVFLMDFLDSRYYDTEPTEWRPRASSTSAIEVRSTIEEYLEQLPAAGLLAKQYYTYDRPIGGQSARISATLSDGTVTINGSPELGELRYQVYRQVNGTPVLDSALGMQLDLDGNVTLVALSGIRVMTAGEPGVEYAEDGTLVVNRELEKEMLHRRFLTEFYAEYGYSSIPIIAWSGFVYARPPGGWYGEPLQMYNFAARASSGEVTARQLWGYRVDDSTLPRYEF